jgi:hypothetical protein
MYSRLLVTAMTSVLVGGVGSTGMLVPPAVPSVLAQDFRNRVRADNSYAVSRLYDRVTDSTRVGVALSSSPRPFGLGSTVWLMATFNFPGRQLQAPPPFVVLWLESWTPARGGWAFAHPRDLRVERGKTRLATIPAIGYVKRPVHLFDRGRSEELSFHIEADELAALAAESELVLKAGSATVRLDERRMARLRALVRQMTVPDGGAR